MAFPCFPVISFLINTHIASPRKHWRTQGSNTCWRTCGHVVLCWAGLHFIWLKLSSSICWGYLLCNLVICCFVFVAHSKLIAKKWRSVRLANVFNITKFSRWHLPLSPHAFPPLHPPLPPLTPLSGVETYQTKWHLRDWLGSLCHLCLEMVECPARRSKSCWRLLPPIG